ncbi:MAG: hypothetical protein H6811_05750 [Phycisphaeraceae bacterium]|nr:hypothetical protein [Phycisphaeraceae bacterium]
MSEGVRAANIVQNPLWLKGVRARLRKQHVLSWGTIVLTVTAFICVLTYLTTLERGRASAETAAKAIVIPIIFIQGAILMLAGTGSVASQLSIEREKGLLDYQRMTPMTPTSKILGYLFGLPARQYFLFLLTVPFIVFAAIVGGINLLSMAHFYAVFFTSVWLYHMTAMVAGMASSKPRQAAMFSQGMVVLLYLILPQLSRFGMTFFEFLTVRPTFYSMVQAELAEANPGLRRMAEEQFTGLTRSGAVPFFHWELHSTVFTLMVQVFLLAAMTIVVHRKWRDEFSHPFSKFQGLGVYAGLLFFLLGGLWPIVSDEHLSSRLMEQFGRGPGSMAPELFFFMLLLVLLLVCGAGMVLIVSLITPNRYTQSRALRLMKKRGSMRVPLDADGASSLPVTIGMIVLTIIAFFALLRHEDASDRFLAGLPGLAHQAAPVAYIAACMLFVQGIRERSSGRVYAVGIFLVWMLPFFVTMVLFAAWNAWLAGAYAGLANPLIGLWLLISNLLHHADPIVTADVVVRGDLAPEALAPHLGQVAMVAVGLYTVLAIVVQVRRVQWRRELRLKELGPDAGRAPQA